MRLSLNGRQVLALLQQGVGRLNRRSTAQWACFSGLFYHLVVDFDDDVVDKEVVQNR